MFIQTKIKTKEILQEEKVVQSAFELVRFDSVIKLEPKPVDQDWDPMLAVDPTYTFPYFVYGVLHLISSAVIGFGGIYQQYHHAISHHHLAQKI